MCTGMIARVRSRDPLLDPRRVDAEVVGLDVAEHRREAVVEDDVRRRDERHGGHQHLVAVLPAVPLLERGERHLERARAAVQHEPVRAAVQRGDLVLELCHHRAGREAVRVQHLKHELLRAAGDRAVADADPAACRRGRLWLGLCDLRSHSGAKPSLGTSAWSRTCRARRPRSRSAAASRRCARALSCRSGTP